MVFELYLKRLISKDIEQVIFKILHQDLDIMPLGEFRYATRQYTLVSHGAPEIREEMFFILGTHSPEPMEKYAMSRVFDIRSETYFNVLKTLESFSQYLSEIRKKKYVVTLTDIDTFAIEEA